LLFFRCGAQDVHVPCKNARSWPRWAVNITASMALPAMPRVVLVNHSFIQ
jgi:hypothetical protein